MYTPLSCFYLSHWLRFHISILFRQFQIFDSFTNRIFLSLSYALLSHRFHVKVFSLSITKPSIGILLLFFVLVLHSVLVTFLYCFWVNTPFYYFILSHCWPILIITLCGLLHIFLLMFHLFPSGPVPLFLCNCHTESVTVRSVAVTQGFTLFVWAIYDLFLFLCSVHCHT